MSKSKRELNPPEAKKTPRPRPRTENQRKYIETVEENRITFVTGVAGSGKTHLAVGLAIQKLWLREFEKIVITRPIVEAGENLGFLPGDVSAKVYNYLLPIFDELGCYIHKTELDQMLANGKTGHRGGIEIAPIAYLRGRTLKNSFIIIDEAQNLTKEQLKMVLTRIGIESKMVLTGDLKQSDLKTGQSGLEHVIKNLQGVSGVGFVRLGTEDIQRDPIVGAILERL